MRNALWHNQDTEGHVKILYKDENELGWEDYKPYRWHLIHRPESGLIQVQIFSGNDILIDSGITLHTCIKK